MEILRIKELGNIFTGKTPPTANPNNFGNTYPFVTPVDLTDAKYINDTERYVSEIGIKHTTLIPENSICVSCIGYIGKIGITKTNSCTNQQINSIIVNDDFDTDFVYYLLSYNVPYFKELAGVNVVPQLNKSDFSKVKLLATKNKPEQTAIATILSKVDEAIESTRQSIKAAEKLKKALMQNLLTGKLKPDGTWRTDDEFYEDEKFGKVPVGWRFGTLNNIAEIVAGQSPTGDTYNDEGKGIPILNGPTEFTDYYPIPVQYTTKPTKICKINDILFTVRGSSTGRMNFANIKYCIGRGIAAIRANEESDIDFLYYTLVTIAHKILAEAKGAGSTFPNVNRGELRKKKIIFPIQKNEQQQIGKKIRTVETEAKSKQTKIQTLQRLKKSLMQNLLTGKIRLDIEAINKVISEQSYGR